MGILSFIADIFSPAADLIDEVVTSDEERMALENELANIKAKVSSEMLELQGKVLEASSKVAVAESQSDSWFTRTYRPMIITGMFILLSANAFGYLEHQLPDLFVQIFGACFGVVGAGRSVEKVFKTKIGR